MWGKIMIPIYRLWLHGLYGLYGPRCPLSPKRPFNLITHSNFVGQLISLPRGLGVGFFGGGQHQRVLPSLFSIFSCLTLPENVLSLSWEFFYPNVYFSKCLSLHSVQCLSFLLTLLFGLLLQHLVLFESREIHGYPNFLCLCLKEALCFRVVCLPVLSVCLSIRPDRFSGISWRALLWLNETGQIWDFRAFPGECMEGMAWKFVCWCILTTYRTD